MPAAEKLDGILEATKWEREQILRHSVPDKPAHTRKENNHQQIQVSHTSVDILNNPLRPQNVPTNPQTQSCPL